MDPARYRLIKDLFAEVRELAPERRIAFLDERCGADAGLREEVAELLRNDARAQGGPLAQALDAESSVLAVPEAPTQVGPYRIRESIGEGGMGEVYLADQEHPIRRTVALKIIRPGIESKAVIARFESERQALAMMDHQNIARAYDAGAMDNGRPYFVMEYVEGIPITEYCDRNRLTTAERLELLAQVCDGLQHAHQKAIIHRDIKPSNVLVTDQGGRPVPKIIDFGVAKAAAQPLTQRTLFTELGQIIGTPEYMSPEQADLTGENVDTRTDIYSLGVLTYEVLVGVLPFDPQELRQAGFDEILRRIRQDDPPRPSTRLSTPGDVPRASLERRRTTAHRLSVQLRGDLDWITMKALEKDRARRYRSAAEMADDLRRFLRHEPVSAGPPGAAYRVSKFARRHRVGVGFASLALAFLVAFVVTTYVQAGRIARERDRANDEAGSARSIAEFLTGLFRDADPGRARGAEVTAREILDAGARRIDLLDAEPLTQASFRETIGSVYGVMGLFDEGQTLLEAAHAYREAQNDGSEARELAYATSLNELGTLYVRRGEPERGEPLARKSAEIREQRLGAHPDLADSLNTLGNALWNSGNMEAAEVHHRRALEIRRASLGPRDASVAGSLHNVGSLRFIAGDLEEAERYYVQALDVSEEAKGPDDYGVATTLHTLAMVYADQGKYDEALPLEERSLAIRENVLGPSHPHVALSLTTLAGILEGLGDPARGEPYARRAVVVGTESWGPDYMDVWWMQRGHAALLNALGRHQEALEIMEPLVTRIEAAPRQVELSLHLAELGASHLGLEQFEAAESAYRRAIVLAEAENGSDDPEAAVARLGLANVLRDSGQTAIAKASYEAALAVLESTRGTQDPDRIQGLRDLAQLLHSAGDEERAAELEAEADRAQEE